MNKKVKILIIPDLLFWITGRIAKEIKNAAPCNFDVHICSGNGIINLTEKFPKFIKSVNIVHFLTPHLSTQYKNLFFDNSAFVSTIHHIESENSIEPATYSDSIMTVSQQWHDKLIEHGVDRKKLVMVQNGIDISLFRPSSAIEKQSLRKKFKIPDNAFVVGFSAKKTSDTCDRKGVDILEALIRFSTFENRKKIFWLIRGPGWNDLVKNLRSQGCELAYFPFVDNDEELSESYRIMDVFLVTARIEGGPVPLLEAMASGLAVITTPVGVSLEIIEHGHNGYIVSFNDYKTIYEFIVKLIEDPNKRKTIGSKAHESIRAKLQWKDTLVNIQNLYDIALSNFYLRTKIENTQNRFLQFHESLDDFDDIKNMEKWIYARECLLFAKFLYSQGALIEARKMANLALRIDPFKMDVISNYLPFSTAASQFKLLRRKLAQIFKL